MFKDRSRAKEKVMSSKAKTFYWALQSMPEEYRHDIIVLYNFCRLLDDLVDEHTDRKIAQNNLIEIEQQLAATRPRCNEVQDFLELAERRCIPPEIASQLIEGLRTDAYGEVRFQTMNELNTYCCRVASTVGLMICRCLDIEDKAALLCAGELGLAMQLTNICRDVQVDFELNRIYLPQEILDHQHIQRAIIDRDDESRRAVFHALKRLVTRAADFYQRSDNGISFLPQPARLGILSASRAYQMIGDLILREPEKYWRQRIATNLLEKNICRFRAILFLSGWRKDSSRKAEEPDKSITYNHLITLIG